MAKIESILVVSAGNSEGLEILKTLNNSGINTIKTLSIEQDIVAAVLKHTPEAVIIETEDLRVELLQQIKEINQTMTIPVLLFTDSEEESLIEQAIKNGVATYIVGALEAQRLPSILQVAIARYKETIKLKRDLDKTRALLEERKLIDKAKGILMQHKQYSEDDAYQALRKMAMDKNKRIVEIADNIISTFELLG